MEYHPPHFLLVCLLIIPKTARQYDQLDLENQGFISISLHFSGNRFFYISLVSLYERNLVFLVFSAERAYFFLSVRIFLRTCIKSPITCSESRQLKKTAVFHKKERRKTVFQQILRLFLLFQSFSSCPAPAIRPSGS
jgi:hypothetical protein